MGKGDYGPFSDFGAFGEWQWLGVTPTEANKAIDVLEDHFADCVPWWIMLEPVQLRNRLIVRMFRVNRRPNIGQG